METPEQEHDDPPRQDPGVQLLSAVERLVASPEEILQLVRRVQRGVDEDVSRVGPRLVSHYTQRSALTGGATALPAMIPGFGSLATLVAGPLADMVLLLKWETELCLALTAAYGYDIRRPEERHLAFLLAAVETAIQAKGRHVIRDAGLVTGTAIWNYTPRRIAKLAATIAAGVMALQFGRAGLKAIPILGVGIGATFNGVLTARVGRRATRELQTRRRLDA